MKHKVLKPFLDSATGEMTNVGDSITIDEESRVAELIRSGLIADTETKALSSAPQNKAMEAAPSNRAITAAGMNAPADRPVTQKVTKRVTKGGKK